MPLNLTLEPMDRLLADCVQSFALSAREKRIAVSASESPSADIQASIDRERMEQAVCNLIGQRHQVPAKADRSRCR
ncbi:MAG: hypothetical protein IPK19_24180 [Chloroflexi bacterium]|nr:hypothetical protein [Chloroflexota bacterium]